MEHRKDRKHEGDAASYALNAMTAAEREDFERLMAQDPAVVEEVRGYVEGAAVLGQAVAEHPPEALKGNVMDAIRDLPQQPTGEPKAPTASVDAEPEPAVGPDRGDETAPTPSRSPRERRSLVGFALAASVLLVAAVALGGILVAEQREAAEVREQLVAAQAETQRMGELLQAPDLRSVQASTTDGNAVTVAYSVRAGLMTVSGEQLPDAPEGRGYELWLIGKDEIIPAGMLTAGKAVTVEGTLDEVTLGITVEPAGGSPQPTTDPILVQEL